MYIVNYESEIKIHFRIRNEKKRRHKKRQTEGRQEKIRVNIGKACGS